MAENVAEQVQDLSIEETSNVKAAGDGKPTAGKKEKQKAAAGTKVELNPWPEYISHRLQMWEKLKAEHNDRIAAKNPTPIRITLPDGKSVDGQAWRTTPYEVAKGISQGLADRAVCAKVNGTPWDLDRPIEENATLELLKFEDDDGQHAFWHSSAHMLGEAMERHYGGHLCYGPPIDQGFFYDMSIQDRVIKPEDYPAVETILKSIIKEKQPFERLEIKKEDLLEMFKKGYKEFSQNIRRATFGKYLSGLQKHNEFKQRILNEKVTTPTTTVYRCGPLIDLCRGPHLRHTGKVKAFKVLKSSSTYWEGKADAETLQRMYGISFPDNKQMKEWLHFQEEAAKRDHRKIGREQELFFFHELSPGSCFFLPRGARIYNTLIDFIKDRYWKRGFQEVVSPNVYNSKLWQMSGHWQHYSENMFSFEVEKEIYALKPMNCPGHCLMFDHRPRSWKELPLRLADFGVLHRNELSGALSGLTRVRRFQQDDAHIFCRVDQIKEEIEGCLDFLRDVYGVLGFTFELVLSTRPEKYLGEIEIWDMAEKQLAESLDSFGHKWDYNHGDGAFYGPKIDITIKDALRRSHQCATIQLDFQLPERFNLTYNSADENQKPRPVIIHRAVLGSVERMIAVLTESYGGKWPFWISPRQSVVVPVGPSFDEYARKVQQQIHGAGFLCDADLDDGTTMNKKIRNSQLAQYNYIFVVGEKEQANGTVNVRTRDNKVHGEHAVSHVIERFRSFTETKVIEDEF